MYTELTLYRQNWEFLLLFQHDFSSRLLIKARTGNAAFESQLPAYEKKWTFEASFPTKRPNT